MSALDIVLQRQVPVRATAKNGESASGVDANAGSENDAFSAVLSGEKRNTAAGRNKIDQDNEPDLAIAADAVDATDPESVSPISTARSDEMLSLLASLMSSAAFTDEKMPAAGDDQTPELELEGAIASDTVEGDTQAGDRTEAEALSAEALSAEALSDDAAPLANEVLTQQIAHPQKAQAPKDPEGTGIAPSQDADKDAKSKADPVVASAVTDQMTQAAMPAQAAAQLGTSARAAQPAQARSQPASVPTASTAQDAEKATGEDNELIRTLGLAKEPEAGSGSRKAGSDDQPGSGAGRKAALVDRAADDQPAAKSGNVEVVESRRFMPAPSLSGNAQLLTRSLGEASDALAAQRAAPAPGAAAAALPQTGQMLHTLKLQLNPIALGSVTAVLKLTGEELSVNIQVETAEAYRQLSDDNQSIVKSLRAQGYAVEQITVQHVASPDRSGNQASQQGFQGNFQGQGSGDAQSSDRGNGGGGSQQGANQQGGQGREQNPYSGAGSGRSDGVYL